MKMKELVFALISILFIIIIVLVIFYKTKNDMHLDTSLNNYNNNHNNTNGTLYNNKRALVIENFDEQQTIIDNNIKINNLLSQLNNESIKLSVDTNAINNSFINNISSNINTVVSNISSYYNTTSNTNAINIKNLENSLIDLENMITNINRKNANTKEYTYIKSLNNGMEMDLIKTPNTYFTDLKTGSNTAAYLLGMNNGCLSVGANDYDVYKCNDKNPKQLFKMQNILNELDYTNNIGKALPFDNFDTSTIEYPFAMIKSVNNDNCLTNNHGEITVQPCYSFVAQRWMPL
jgi:hypothetical protein